MPYLASSESTHDSRGKRSLYRPEFEHDACGIGALANING